MSFIVNYREELQRIKIFYFFILGDIKWHCGWFYLYQCHMVWQDKINIMKKITIGAGVFIFALLACLTLMDTKAYAKAEPVRCNCGFIWGHGCYADNYGATCAYNYCNLGSANCAD